MSRCRKPNEQLTKDWLFSTSTLYAGGYFTLLVLSYSALRIPCLLLHRLPVSSTLYCPNSECPMFSNYQNYFHVPQVSIRGCQPTKDLGCQWLSVAGQPRWPLACWNHIRWPATSEPCNRPQPRQISSHKQAFNVQMMQEAKLIPYMRLLIINIYFYVLIATLE